MSSHSTWQITHNGCPVVQYESGLDVENMTRMSAKHETQTHQLLKRMLQWHAFNAHKGYVIGPSLSDRSCMHYISHALYESLVHIAPCMPTWSFRPPVIALTSVWQAWHDEPWL